MSERTFDVAVVGAGIVGLSVALAAVRKGKRVVVFDRSAKAIGASIRNFGFVTVSGQRAGEHWARARRARDIWAEVAAEAGIQVQHQGLLMPARRSEAVDVLHAFLASPMGVDCRMVTREEALEMAPNLRMDEVKDILYSSRDMRVESVDAIPRIAAWLADKHGVSFNWSTAVYGVEGNDVITSRGTYHAESIVVCPGDDLATLFPERLAEHKLSICTLQMLRLDPGAPGIKVNASVMSDMSLARYEGFAELPEAKPLIARLEAEERESREAGIHLIVVQSADGSLVVGDSHVYGASHDPFARTRFDELILDEFDRVFDLPKRQVVRRWVGSYVTASDRTVLVDQPAAHVRLVMVTGGTGASTGFALGEQVVDGLYS